MTPSWEVLAGDCRDVLPRLPAGSVHTVVTSPPYFGLRDYGTGEWDGGDAGCDHVDRQQHREQPGRPVQDGAFRYTSTPQPVAFGVVCGRCGARRVDRQLGLEPTPDQFVAALVGVFREVWRVLRDDGTVWLNLGDSYNAYNGNRGPAAGLNAVADAQRNVPGRGLTSTGCKPKDLIGIPWMVAFALRQPYYAGTITNELDRVWLAAMIDAEGCVYIHRRREGQSNGQGYVRKTDSFGSGLEVANTSLRVVERCREITGRGSISRQDKDRRQPLYRWCLRTNECRDVLREVYPYLVAKQHEARLACGVASSGERAVAAWEALKLLHGGSETTVDFAAPESLHTPGWYLRSEVIWSKLNPMPESVTDRPTRAHEQVFLLSKGPRYFYDAEAIRDESSESSQARAHLGGEASGRGRSFVPPGWPLSSRDPPRTYGVGRNKRSVWTVATQPYAGAHFATFPPKLIEPCVLAGCPERCCAECGAPWERLTEREDQGYDGSRYGERAVDASGGAKTGGTARSTLGSSNGKLVGQSRTVGFRPSCSCDKGTTAGTVLDPFAGAGTTGLVAVRSGRAFVGCELSDEYAAMARERIATDVRLGHRSPVREQPPAPGQGTLELFGGSE